MAVQVWRAILFALGIVIVIGTIFTASATYNRCLFNYHNHLEEYSSDQARTGLRHCISPISLDVFESGRTSFTVHKITGEAGTESFWFLIGSMLILLAFFLPRSTETYIEESGGDEDTKKAIPPIISYLIQNQKPKQSVFVRAVEIGAALAAIVGTVVAVMSFLKD